MIFLPDCNSGFEVSHRRSLVKGYIAKCLKIYSSPTCPNTGLPLHGVNYAFIPTDNYPFGDVLVYSHPCQSQGALHI